MSDGLHKKLLDSDSNQSFATEEVVASTLEKLGWNSVQGAIYLDPKELKAREIDILAHRVWRTKAKAEQDATVVLAVECKTMRGFHILVNDVPRRDLNFQNSGLSHWLGYSIHDDRDRLIDILHKHQYSVSEISKILQKVSRICYPKDIARVNRLIVKPAPVHSNFTAFRETNIGDEKNLESSVFWRAILTLDSCTNSLKRSLTDGLLDDLKVDATALEQDDEEKMSVFSWPADEYSRRLSLYHPIVVTDAKLWCSSHGKLVELEAARYVRTDGFHGVDKWFDVVQREHFSEYATRLATYYEKAFRLARAKGRAQWPKT
ncbi:MAG TPA: hypothetical protein VMV97_11430 [Sulfuriferula sp.]|nr:hypothetical protein [Sulfuriferula sp.]